MKNIILSISILLTIAGTISSCTPSSNKEIPLQINDNKVTPDSQELKPIIQSDTVIDVTSTEPQPQKESKSTEKEQLQNLSIAPVIKEYLALKNALTTDDDKAAANAGKQLFMALNKLDIKKVTANKQKEFMVISENAKENAEHIGDNAGKIEHQREHLASLSVDISDLITLIGTTQKLYQTYCPMYKDKKGAIWISETKTIKNPYYGTQMSTCGSVKKEF